MSFWLVPGGFPGLGAPASTGVPDLLTNPDHLSRGLPGSSPSGAEACPVKIVTWLILPVVICLSQRLSHACLSISNLYGETANGLNLMGRSEYTAGLRPATVSKCGALNPQPGVVRVQRLHDTRLGRPRPG